MKGITSCIVGLAVASMLLLPANTRAQAGSLPPDTVTTLFRSDTIAGGDAVGGIASDASGFLYVADFRNSVWRVSPEGSVELFADGLYGASGNAVGPRGSLFQSSFHGDYVSRISRTNRAVPRPNATGISASRATSSMRWAAAAMGRLGSATQ